jgi:uncharacterized protein (TIGR03437 family)
VDTGIKGDVAVGFGDVQGGLLFRDPQHGWVGAWDVVLSTSDGGAHWIKQNLGCVGDLYILCVSSKNDIAFTDSQNGWIAGEGLFRTTDGGAAWSVAIPKSGWYHALQFLDPRDAWLAGDYGELRYTNDGGEHWQLFDSTTGVALQGLYFLNLKRGWIVGDNGTILSYAGDRIAAGKPAIFGVVNGESFQPGIASGAWVSIVGENLSSSTRAWSGADFNGSKLPTQLDGVGVSINGLAGYPSFISPAPINFLAPANVPEGPVPVEVVTGLGRSDSFVAQQGRYSPGLFRYPIAGGRYIVAQASDGSWIGGLNLMYEPGMPAGMREAKPGEIVTLYGTGFGLTDPPAATGEVVTQPVKLAAPVTFYFGRTAADVVWAGLIGPGLYQFNIKIPAVAGGNGDHVLVAEIGGYRSQADSLITVQQ